MSGGKVQFWYRYFNWPGLVRAAVLPFCLFGAGCAAPPSQTESLDYRARAETQVNGDVRVSAVVLSQQESENSFGFQLARRGIQPIWLEIENQEDKELYLMLLSLDPNYFSPSELAWMFQGESDNTLDELSDIFLGKHIKVIISPHSTVSGFVYTNRDPGVKAFAVELFGAQDHRIFEFVQIVPGFEADFMRVDFSGLYAPGEVRDLDLDGLRQYLEGLPCCVFGGDEETPGDPLNLVIVGEGKHVLATLVRRGWDLTETMRNDTVWRTIASSIFRSQYRTSPVSPMYLFDRPHDAALQKTRGSVDERNHLRLWRAPVTLNGQMVWVGQISRDIGVRFSRKTFVTHKIDPHVDEARLYITLDLAASRSIQTIGYVKGVGYANRELPRFNYTRDPYYTDGLRVVLLFGTARYPLDSIDYLPWLNLKGRNKIPTDLTP